MPLRRHRQPDIAAAVGNGGAFARATDIGRDRRRDRQHILECRDRGGTVSRFAAGVAIHALPRLRRLCDPLLASYYSVPVFVFYPLLVSLLGLNRWPLVAIGFIFGVTAMVIATLNGLDRVPRVLLKLARVHRMSRSTEVLSIVLPAAAPYLFTGGKLALAYAFIGVIAGEFILSGGGLGYAIAYAYDAFDNRTMYALMLFVLIVVTAVNAALYVWEQRLLRRRGRA